MVPGFVVHGQQSIEAAEVTTIVDTPVFPPCWKTVKVGKVFPGFLPWGKPVKVARVSPWGKEFVFLVSQKIPPTVPLAVKKSASDCRLTARNRPLKVYPPRSVEIQHPGGFAPVFHFHIVLFFGPPPFFSLVPSPARRRTWEPNISYHGVACFLDPRLSMLDWLDCFFMRWESLENSGRSAFF